MKNKFEILCVTMNQTDFSKVRKMNIHSNVVFANQSTEVNYKEENIDGTHIAKMITTNTTGVGKNRNIALLYADAEYCLFADDDIVYYDDLEEKIVKEFEDNKDADVIVFNVDTDSKLRKQKKYLKTKRCSRFVRMPWGAVRIAVRLEPVKKKNIWYTTLFGGGCVFPSGEDSTWLIDAKRKGLRFYVSDKTIGKVSFEESTWFTGYDEKYFYGRGTLLANNHMHTFAIWVLYFVFRTRKLTKLSCGSRIKWMFNGLHGYKKMISFDSFVKRKNI